MHQLYKNIKTLREERGMSQTQLADLTGYTHRSSITKIEKGEVDLPLSKVEQFAKVFGKEPGDIVGWEDDDTEKEESPKIMEYYEKLNDIGKHEAEKRVMELTEIPRYTKKDFTYVNAAHSIDGASEEDKKFDENIMDDENF